MGVRLGSSARAEPVGKRSAVTTILFALLFVAWVGEWPIEIDTATYNGAWRSIFVVFSPLFTPVPGISLFPWQILLVAVAPFCCSLAARRLHAREMDRAILVGLACVAVTFLWGLLKGGSAYFAYYQLWRYLAALLIAYLLMSALETQRDLISLGKIVIISALIRATLCIYYYAVHLNGKVDPLPEYVISHDDSMLFVLAIQIAWIWAILKGGRQAWMTAILVSAWVVYAIVLNDRRIAWVELLISAPLIYLVIGPGELRKRLNRWAMIVAPLGLGYFAAATVSDNAIFSPVHALLTTGSYEDASSLTREEEIRNLLRTLVDYGNPLFGTGWGRPYIKFESIYSNYSADWILVLYTPHNSIVGLAAYAGFIGFFGMWGILPVSAYLAARGYRNSTAPVVRAASITAIAAIGVYGVHCYGDIGLQSFTGSVILGVALATAARAAGLGEALAVAEDDLKVQQSSASRSTRRRLDKVPVPSRRLARWRP